MYGEFRRGKILEGSRSADEQLECKPLCVCSTLWKVLKCHVWRISKRADFREIVIGR